MGQLDMNHALVMALATIHLGNVTATQANVTAVCFTMEQLAQNAEKMPFNVQMAQHASWKKIDVMQL